MISPKIQSIYENYLEEVRKATSNDVRRFGALTRMFTGKQSDAEALLPRFDEEVKNDLHALFGQYPDSGAVKELAEWMLGQLDAWRDDAVIKYSFMAVQRHLIPLVGCLSGDDAAYLAKRFESEFPRRERFPSHVELIAKLKAQAQKNGAGME